MYCVNCGGKIPDGAHFCTNCGTRVSGGGGADNKKKRERQHADGQNTLQWKPILKIALNLLFATSVILVICLVAARSSYTMTVETPEKWIDREHRTVGVECTIKDKMSDGFFGYDFDIGDFYLPGATFNSKSYAELFKPFTEENVEKFKQETLERYKLEVLVHIGLWVAITLILWFVRRYLFRRYNL